jgi:hypothetical protein
VCNSATGTCSYADLPDNTACGTGLICCGGSCVGTNTATNCGQCGQACTGTNRGCINGQCVCTNTCTNGMVPNATTCVCECPSGTTVCPTTAAGEQCCSNATQYCGRYGAGVVGCLDKVCNEFGAGICAGGGGTCAGDPSNPNSACACGRTADGGQACLAASECQMGEPCETNADCPEGTVCAVTGTAQQATGPNRCVRVCQLTPA